MTSQFNPDPQAQFLAGGLSRRTAGFYVGGLGAALTLPFGMRRVAAQDSSATPVVTTAFPPLIEQWLAAWGGDLDQAGALYLDDAVLEDVASGTVFHGREAIEIHIADLSAGFPGHAYELLSAFVAEDRAAFEFQWTATYTGSLPELPAGTGQAVSLRGAVFIELAGNMSRREAHYYDAYAFLVQLGVLPAPSTSEATPTP